MAKLNNYKGSVELISGLTCKDGMDIPLMEAHSIMVAEDGKRLDAELLSIATRLSLLDPNGDGNGNGLTNEQLIEIIDNYLNTTIPDWAKTSDKPTYKYDEITEKPTLANVARTGSYNDLTDTPTLANVATTGSYNNLTDTPTLANVARTGSYNDLTGTPTLANVATTGSYNDLTDTPTLANVATTGSYNNLTDTPTLLQLGNTQGTAYEGSAGEALEKRVQTLETNGVGTPTVGSITANKVTLSQDITVAQSVGYIDANTTFSQGTTIESILNQMFDKELNPTKINPSVGITLTVNGFSCTGAYEVGNTIGSETAPIKYTATFDEGDYTFKSDYESDPDSTGVTVKKWRVVPSSGIEPTITSTANTITGDLGSITVSDNTNYSVTAYATHTDGAIPLTNKGNAYTDAKIESRTPYKSSDSITGYRQFFYGALTTSSTDTNLTSEIIRGNLTHGGAYDSEKTLTIKAADVTGAKRFVVAIPYSSIRGGVTNVILTSAMNTPITSDYIKTERAVEVAGANGYKSNDENDEYDVWVYEPASIASDEIHEITIA